MPVSRQVLILLVPLIAAAQGPQGVRQAPSLREAPFKVLDNVEGDEVDLLNYPVEPMVVSPNHATLWAVNTHASEVVGFTSLGGQPSKVYPVPWNPVSIEYWVSSLDGHHELLVVTRGTHGLTRLAPSSGAILGYLALPPEPGGTFLLEDHLFVACSALDQVVEIDLPTSTIFQTFEIDTSRHLLFLSGDGLGNVLVTPLLSGNNSMPRRSAVAGVFASDPQGNVLDMTDPAQADVPFPDEDLFRIVPGATPGGGHVEVAATGVGTVLLAHDRNPVTGKLWVLNTQANNADALLDTEPELRGVFAENRLTLVDLPPVGGAPAAVHTVLSLDTLPPAPLGKPFALAFTSTGEAVIAGALTDNVSVLSASGAHLLSWSLPPGSIPRGVLVDEVTRKVYVHCWGTNEVEVRDMVLPVPPVVARLDLGHDPTSPRRQEGRALFYDAHNSLQQNLACESCHVEGMFDHLVWNLSDVLDDEGALFTQNLKGIQLTRPYGWRGEREFPDFNREFASLLGGTELAADRFEAFREFVFGLANPANPYEHPRRVVSDDRERRRFDFPTQHVPSALNGQEIYFRDPTVGIDTCQECHQLPTGTNNDFFPATKADTGHRNTLKNTPYNGMWRKEQKTRVTIKERFRPAEERPPLGAGASRAGLASGLWEFALLSFNARMPVEDKEDVAFYVHQIDQGLAPAVHRAVLVSPAQPSPPLLADYFEPQVAQRNCDLAVIGSVDLGAGPQKLRWYWDRTAKLFLPEDRDLPGKPLAFFVQQAQAGTGTNLFVGLPVGMARRFAVDPDGDLLFRQDETQLGTDGREPDSDGDGFLDGTEVRFGSNPLSAASLPGTAEVPVITRVREMLHTTRVAKLIVETDRPVHVRVDYSSNLGDAGQVVEDGDWKTLWQVALLDLLPSNELTGLWRVYSGTITVTDEFGHQTQAAMPGFETKPFTNAMETGVPKPIELETILRDLALVSAAPAGPGGWDFAFTARVENRKSAASPLAAHVVVARVIRNALVEADIDMNGGPPADEIRSELSFNGLYGGFGGFGPFVVGTISAADGVSTLAFRLPAAASGDRVQLAIEMVGRPLDVATFDPHAPSFDGLSLFDFSNTPPEFRASGVIVLP